MKKQSSFQQTPPFDLRPASVEEAGLFYSNDERDEALGTVGHLRMDFGSGGKGFHHTWWPHNEDRFNTPEFKEALQKFVDAMRQDGPLKNLAAMNTYCWHNGGEIAENDRVYGFISETEHYRFCLRCTPRPGDYQGYLYVYDLRQQEMARQDKLVGRVSYASGEKQEFTDAGQYLQAIREELPYTQGNSFRRNVEGGDPRCSFHWFGNSGRLYVFEAPIDLLAFLTLYPEAWREHSYVALCGTSEQAMLWMLEKDPRIQRVVLCLDHDAAGIEATGRLTDLLREHGHTRVSVQRPEYKDWDEDLKALHGLPAQPAEQHPQLQAAELVCARIAVKCMDLKPDGAMQQVPHLFQCYRKCLKEKKLETAMDCMEEMAALSLLVTLRECRQLGTALTPTQGSQYLQSHILPHQNRMAIRNRTEEISAQLQNALAKSGAPGVRGEAEKREIASAWLELALSCAKVSVKNDADELKAMEKQKQALGMEMG